MKNIKRIICAALVGTFALSTVGCSFIKKTPEAIANSPVATVNGTKITKAQLDDRMKSVIENMKSQYGADFEKTQNGKDAIKEQQSSTLDELIMEELLLQKAKSLKLEPKESDLKTQVDKYYNDMKTQLGGESKFKTALKQAGFTETSLKEYYKTRIIIGKVSDYIVKNVKVSDDKVKEEYDLNKFKYTESPDTMHLQHILVKTEDEAKAVKARIDKGEDFATVAKQVSIDTGTKDKGGDLGDVQYFDSGMVAEFITAAMKLKAGEVSGPVKSQYGYHIIKCINRKEYPFKKFDAVKDEIKKNLLQTAQSDEFSKVTKKWKSKAKIVKYTKNM